MTTVVVGIIIRAQFNTLGVKRYNHSARKLIFFLSSYQEKTNKCVQSKHFDSLKEKHENLYLESLHCGRWEDYKERGNDCWHYNCGHLVGLSYMNVSTYDLHLLHLKWIGNSHYHRNTNVGSLLIKYFPVELMFTGLVEKITLSCHSQRLLKILGKRDSSQP